MPKRPRPPKCWDPRTAPGVPIHSGVTPNGMTVVHPERFKQLVAAGVIDSKGRRISA